MKGDYGERDRDGGYSHSHSDPVTPETVKWIHCLDTSVEREGEVEDEGGEGREGEEWRGGEK